MAKKKVLLNLGPRFSQHQYTTSCDHSPKVKKVTLLLSRVSSIMLQCDLSAIFGYNKVW